MRKAADPFGKLRAGSAATAGRYVSAGSRNGPASSLCSPD